MKKLQQPFKEEGPLKARDLSEYEMENSSIVAVQIEKEIAKVVVVDEKKRMEKFRYAMTILMQHQWIKLQLLRMELSAEKFVTMEKDDLLSDEMRLQRAKTEEDAFNAQRTDWQRAQQLKEGIKDGMYTCKRCKSKKTQFYSQQTRGADEPMTNFITCITCGYNWKD